MTTEFYSASGTPSTSASGTSSTMRAEFALVEAGFAKFPTMSTAALKTLRVNSGGTAIEAAAVTGTGNSVYSTSPTLVTPILGVATVTSINGMTITASTGTFTLTNLKTFTVSNTLTLAGTDGSTLNVGTGGTLGTGAFATISLYATLASPVFTTPTLGAATATSINGLTMTSSTGTLTIANGKTLTASNTLTLTATDGSTLAIGTGGTLATAAYQTIGNVRSSTSALGYSTGAGGAVSQICTYIGSIPAAPGVTLNTVCGAITCTTCTIGASQALTFTVTNSQVAATDAIHVNLKSIGGGTTGQYLPWVEAVAAGSFVVSIRNVGSVADGALTLILNFAVIKAVAS